MFYLSFKRDWQPPVSFFAQPFSDVACDVSIFNCIYAIQFSNETFCGSILRDISLRRYLLRDISLRRYLLRDIYFVILAYGDICCAIATSCLCVFVFKKCFNRRRIQRLYPQLCTYVVWFFSLSYKPICRKANYVSLFFNDWISPCVPCVKFFFDLFRL